MHIVLDESAMAAVGQGNVLASRFIHRAHAEADWFLYAPACALVEADRARPGTAEHLAAMPGITVLDLDLAAALAIAGQQTWAAAHSQHAAQPTPGSTVNGTAYEITEAVGKRGGPRPGPHPVADAAGPSALRVLPLLTCDRLRDHWRDSARTSCCTIRAAKPSPPCTKHPNCLTAPR
jgi:hypothetical protein